MPCVCVSVGGGFGDILPQKKNRGGVRLKTISRIHSAYVSPSDTHRTGSSGCRSRKQAIALRPGRQPP